MGVTSLAATYANYFELSFVERRLVTAAALLHDIGHAPLSHSLEPVFLKFFGMEHHTATRDIVTGRVSLGRPVYELLKHNRVDIERLVAFIDGTEGSAHADFFAGPINFDTIEGITRTSQYSNSTSISPTPRDILTAAILRRNDTDRIMVDISGA